MKFLIFSDLHLEFLNQNSIDNLLGNLEKNNVDGCIVAGDIAPLDRPNYYYFLCWLGRSFKQSFVILGNHEYYDSEFTQTALRFESFKYQFDNITFLNNNLSNVGNCLIGGTTLWFEETPNTIIYKNQINCWKYIDNLEHNVYVENSKSIDFIKYFNSILHKPKILITHYLPFNQSITERYKGDKSNCFYVCDLSKYLWELNFDLIVHGHTHDSCDYTIGNTKVVCNPYGYCGQNIQFDFCKIVEI